MEIGADWNAAEGEPGHILNRTHWVEQNSRFIAEIQKGSHSGDNVPFSPVVGEKYLVTFGETSYPVVAKRTTDGGTEVIYIGNASIRYASEQNTGEPWVYYGYASNGAVFIAALDTDATATAETISVYQNTEVINKLDPKFLPDGVVKSVNGVESDETGNVEISIPTVPTKVSAFTNDKGYLTEHQDLSGYAKKSEIPSVPVQSVNGKTGEVNLDANAVGARPASWTPTYTDVGADKSGTATTAVSNHNTNTEAHNDIRLLITALTTRLDALANSDDETLDQMAEVVAYIKANRDLIDQITTGKVSVTDIVNNLTTNVSNKPLSAAQGAVLKALIDALDGDKLDSSALPMAINTALAQAKESGEFDGADGKDGTNGKDGTSATHSWNGTVLTVTSASGTSSANLKGEKGDKGDSIKGDTGATGADGVSPTVAVSKSGKVTTISITDKNGTKTATINDGADGASGSAGKDGTSVTVKSVSESTADGGSNVVTFSDGKAITVKNGNKGDPGDDAVLTMFIAPNGNDSNNGLTANTPKKTVKACVNAGATRISAKRGVYNELIQLSDIGELEILPTDNDLTYAVGVEREPIVFDTSDSIAVSSLAAYNSIKRVAYSNSTNTQFDKVFTKKSQPPIYGDGYGSRYNSAIWLLSSDEKTVCIKLKPVLTVAECEAEANTFTYVSGYIYINASMTGVDKIVVPTNWDCGIYINGANRFVLKEVEVRFAGSYNIDIRNCAFFDFYKCACKYTSYGSGFHPFNSNGRMTACYATKNFDGYGISGFGHTTYVDCVSEFNFDDGMSHHNATSGTVIGGRFEGNGKGGNTPAYGAKVNIYGGLYKDNASFGIGYLWATDLEPASGMVQGAVMVGNPIGLSVQKNCDVIAMNCVYNGNTKDKDVKGNLTEYNANYVKTVNGVEPDENGNVIVKGGPSYTNVLKSAIDTDGSIYNGIGYKNGYRLNSSATEKEQSGCGHTGFIKVINGDTVRMQNYSQCQVGYGYIHYYDASFSRVNTKQPDDNFVPDANGMYTIVINSTCEYIRLSMGEFSEETIITVNEEIT